MRAITHDRQIVTRIRAIWEFKISPNKDKDVTETERDRETDR